MKSVRRWRGLCPQVEMKWDTILFRGTACGSFRLKSYNLSLFVLIHYLYLDFFLKYREYSEMIPPPIYALAIHFNAIWMNNI